MTLPYVGKPVSIRAAVLHFGRKPDGYGGKAELARHLGITQSAIGRWRGPNLPEHHARRVRKHFKGATK